MKIKDRIPRKSEFKIRLKEAMTIRGISQSELVQLTNIPKSAISQYLSGSFEPRKERLSLLAKVLTVREAWLIGYDVPIRVEEKSYIYDDYNACYSEIEEPVITTLRIPVLGYVAAGIPISAIEDIIDYEELAPDMVKDGAEYFALQIKGQSMEPKISDGDVVIVRKQPDVDSGQIAIVCVNGDEATCKKIMKQDSGILLLPLNPTFAPTFYSNEDIERIPITILGRVVELRAKF